MGFFFSLVIFGFGLVDLEWGKIVNFILIVFLMVFVFLGLVFVWKFIKIKFIFFEFFFIVVFGGVVGILSILVGKVLNFYINISLE